MRPFSFENTLPKDILPVYNMASEQHWKKTVMQDSFPNSATLVAYNYAKEAELTGPDQSIKDHIAMLYFEARKAHPFVGTCVKQVYNKIDWEFLYEALRDSS